MGKVKWKTWLEDGAIIIQADFGDIHTRRKVELKKWYAPNSKYDTFAMLIWGMQLDIDFLAGKV